MQSKGPDPEQVYWGLRAMKTVAVADGALDSSELHMMESIQQILGTRHPLEELASNACGSGAVSDVTTGT